MRSFILQISNSTDLFIWLIEFLTNSSQYKNANIANFILALPLEMELANEVFKPKI